MTRSVVQVRVDEETLVLWRTAASEDRVSLSEFVRAAVDLRLKSAAIVHDALVSREIDERLGRPGPPVYGHPEPVVYGTRPKARRNVAATPRTCDRRAFHRSGVYCKTCGATP